MFTTVKVLNHPELPSFIFSAGPYCAAAPIKNTVPIPVGGASYEITTKVDPTSFGGWRYELANIQGYCKDTNSCTANMSASSGANVVVNYHWACDQLICGRFPAQPGQLPPGLDSS